MSTYNSKNRNLGASLKQLVKWHGSKTNICTNKELRNLNGVPRWRVHVEKNARKSYFVQHVRNKQWLQIFKNSMTSNPSDAGDVTFDPSEDVVLEFGKYIKKNKQEDLFGILSSYHYHITTGVIKKELPPWIENSVINLT